MVMSLVSRRNKVTDLGEIDMELYTIDMKLQKDIEEHVLHEKIRYGITFITVFALVLFVLYMVHVYIAFWLVGILMDMAA